MDGVGGGPNGEVSLSDARLGKIFCTWMLSLGGEHLIERIGVLSPAKRREFDVAMELSGAE